MNFKGLGLRATASFALCASLASCGGGDIIEPFAPTRIIAFGDESSYIGASGTEKYTINGADCAANPIWLQSVATAYGLALPGCLGTATSTSSRIYAAPGATVAQLSGQIGNVSDWNATTLATVMIGTHDIKALYEAYASGAATEAEQLAEAALRGKAVATHINAMADAGGRVLLLTAPNLDASPYGLAQTNVAVLKAIREKFNLAIRTNVYEDGYRIGKVIAGDQLQILINGTANPFTNTTQAACGGAVLPACDASTTTLNSAWDTWLWADDVQPSPRAHAYIGAAAVSLLARLPL